MDFGRPDYKQPLYKLGCHLRNFLRKLSILLVKNLMLMEGLMRNYAEN